MALKIDFLQSKLYTLDFHGLPFIEKSGCIANLVVMYESYMTKKRKHEQKEKIIATGSNKPSLLIELQSVPITCC